jgi:hypothetical protein
MTAGRHLLESFTAALLVACAGEVPRAPSGAAPGDSPSPLEERGEQPSARCKATAASQDPNDAYLNLVSNPPSFAFVDGVPVGRTPLCHFAVGPGHHQVKFIALEKGLSKTLDVCVACADGG